MDDPVTGIDVVSAGHNLVHGGHVRVPQGNDVQRRVVLQLLGRPAGQKGRSSVFGRAVPGVGACGRAGHPIRNSSSQIRMQPTEQPPREPAPEDQSQDSVTDVARPEPVAVGDEDRFALDTNTRRVPPKVHADVVAEEVAAPPVVVAAHDEHRHSAVHEIGKASEYPDVLSEYDPAVLEPEVEQVPIDDQAATRFLYVQKPTPESLLGFPGDGTEVDIGYEEHRFGTHDRGSYGDERRGGREVNGSLPARWAAAVLSVALATACATPGYLRVPALAGLSAEAEAAVLVAARDTGVSGARQLRFTWSAREPDFVGSGFGVARIEPPYKARLDLFLNNGESAAIAALVEDELRVPGGLPLQLVPPPALLWATLGVFRPGARAELLGGRVAGGVLDVQYRLPHGDRVHFRLRDRTIMDVSRLEGEDVVEHVFVSAPEEGSDYPAEATYRNLRDYRELKLQLEFHEQVDSFPPDIWRPNGL